MAASFLQRVRERRARNNARYDRPPPWWFALLPTVSLLILIVFQVVLPPGRRNRTTNLTVSGVYLLVVFAGVVLALLWLRRHLLPEYRRRMRWHRIVELGSPTRFRQLAPVGALFFILGGVLLVVHLLEGAVDERWGRLVSSAVLLPIWLVASVRSGLATRRLLRGPSSPG